MTTRKRLVGWAGLLTLLVAGGVHAAAPADQYSFFTADADEIIDIQTELVWERRPPFDGSMDFAAAKNHCEQVDGDAGHKGWRLPTVKELLTLVDEEGYATYEDGGLVYHAIDRNAFPGTPTSNFWTSSTSSGSQDMWVVNFGTGETSKRAGSESAYVRCVRNK